MLGIPLRVDDRADHSFDAPVIIGAAIYLEVFDIGLAAPALPARISQIHSSTDSGGRKSVRSAIARMIPDTKPACASSMGRVGHDVHFTVLMYSVLR